ncbi:MAG TPA: prepilin-type N-terminal cleavage/methylation domain-containing protein [Gemmatimonadaceae bacterium]|nr:prepilin-type N-terminal cleavage/methylation domain-containing protein [Gemmatimonadaceae bacterium]
MAAKRTGFTLIEILIVVVLIGSLAAIAIPRYAGSKDRAYAAAMKADLHTAALYEEQYAAENHGQYFAGSASHDSPLNGFTPSAGVTVTFTAFNILGSQLADWTAVARHGMSTESCEMRTGVITCTTDNGLATGVLHVN